MNQAQLTKIMEKHRQHEVMKVTQAICKNGKNITLITKMNGVTHVNDSPQAFETFIKEYDKRNHPGKKK